MAISVAHLRTFHGVALEGGFSKAARALSISQSTLSIHVSALEEGFGVTLTKFALDVLPITSRLFECMDEAEDLLTGTIDLEGGYLLFRSHRSASDCSLYDSLQGTVPRPPVVALCA